jgi:predicted ArsR family transcriptional regulator
MVATRDLVLKTIQRKQPVSIVELADAVGINPISVRHHISNLEESGLVASEDKRHGVGRPLRLYLLTEKGHEHFPTQSLRLASSLIQQLKETLPERKLDTLFRDIGARMYENESKNLEPLNLDARLDLIDRQLTGEGFTVRIERTESEIRIHETSCPYFHVGQEHHEVCTIDRELINTALESESERTACLLHGDSQCTYVIPLDAIPVGIQ